MMNRLCLFLAGAAVFSTIAAASAAGDDAVALLAKHAAYVGWHAGDGAVKTLRATGDVTTSGQVPDRIRLLRYGVAFRATFEDSRGFQYDDGFTGNVFWTTSSNGFTVRPVGEAARYRIGDQALFGELTTAFAPAFQRRETVDGVETAVLRLTNNVAFPVDVYVDSATGAYRRAVIDPGGKYEEVVNGLQYTEVQGKRFISGWHYGKSKSLYHYDKIELNPEVLRTPCARRLRPRPGRSPTARPRSSSPRTRSRASS